MPRNNKHVSIIEYQNDGHENYAVTWTHIHKCKNVGPGMLNSTSLSPQPFTQKGKQQQQILAEEKK